MAADDLYNLASGVLAKAVAAYTAAARTPPARQYVSAGVPAWDDEQLVVEVAGLRWGHPQQPGIALAQGYALRTADLVVHVTRCMPGPDDNGNPPTADVLDSASQTLLGDAWTVFEALATAAADKTLNGCASVVVGQADIVGPEGGLADMPIGLSFAI